MRPESERIIESAARDLAACGKPHELDLAKAGYLGKKGVIALELRKLSELDPTERRERGRELNALRDRFESMLEERKREIAEEELARSLDAERVDVTLPGRRRPAGSLHPLSLAQERLQQIFASVGFDVADGPEVESDLFNFTLLNHPQDHPARSQHDTFYVEGHPDHLLRTHTSPVQIRYAKGRKPPLRVIAPGKVYRVDHDATHSPMFHQAEGMWIDERIRFSDLKGMLEEFFRLFFDDPGLQMRFRPSFFPFTEPSAEFDIRRSGRWLEVCGCGMMHPNVLRSADVDPGRFQGFAFGVGLERLAMLLYGIEDIRMFFENDARFLERFASS